MATLTIKQHDTNIKFTDTPTIDELPVPVADFSGATVSFIMKSTDPAVSIKQDAVIITDDPPNARFEYEPEDSDVQTVGKFRQEWEVAYLSGKILSFPNGTYNTVKIIADLG